MAPGTTLPPTIGLLTLRLDNGLSCALWKGVREGARAQGMSLACFPETSMESSRAGAFRRSSGDAYLLARNASLEGLVVWTGGLTNTLSPEGIESLCRSFGNIPMVTVGYPCTGLPVVDCDHAEGFRKLVRHLLDHHQTGNPAWIPGPGSHPFQEERTGILRQELAERGISPDPGLWATPRKDWTECGDGIVELMDDRELVPGRDFQCIMAASDSLAARTIQILESRGIRVPEDVAVTGFDGEHLHTTLVPHRITTVSLGMEEQGHRAADLLVRLMSGQEVPPVNLVPAGLLLQDTCRCLARRHPQDRKAARAPVPALPAIPGYKAPDAPSPGIPTPGLLLARMLESVFPRDAASISARILEAAEADLREDTPVRLMECFAALMREWPAADLPEDWTWLRLLAHLKQVLYPMLPDGELRKAVTLMDDLAARLSQAENQLKNYQIGIRETRLSAMRMSMQWFASVRDEKELRDILPGQIIPHGIHTCAILLYDQGQGADSPVRTFFDMQKGIPRPTDSGTLPAGTLIPPSWDAADPHPLLVIPLNYHDIPFGFMSFRVEDGPGEFMYTNLAAQVGTPLWSMLVLRERDGRERELSLAKEEAEGERRKAEAATAAKSSFLATMSHELRTPLTAILGLSSLLMDSPMDPRQSRYVQTIRSSGDVLLGIISDILDFSKIEAGKLDLEITEFCLNDLVESCLDLFGLRCSQKGLDQFFHLDHRLPSRFWGDTTRIRQILVNLMNNAVKFTDSGHITISVTREEDGSLNAPVDDDTVMVHACITDTGIGIKPEHQERLFRSFSQGDTSTTRKYGGSGLGLTISLRLAELMGGRLWMESAGVPGEGSRFHVMIPLRTCATQREQLPDPVAGRKVLVVHPDAHMRAHLENCLQGLPLEVENIPSPRIALRYLCGPRRPGGPSLPDLIIIDGQTRDFSGNDFVLRLRRKNACRSIPVVMLVQMDALPGRTLRKSLAYCTKPVHRSALEASMRALWEHPDTIIRPERHEPRAFDHELSRACPLRILLAEDNQVNQMLLLAMLERFGFRADVAQDGKDAINKASRKIYDLILMDIQMPQIDGIEAAGFLLSHLRASWRPRIVAISANALQDDRMLCFQAGMEDYISKPVQPHDISRVIRETWTRMDPKRQRQRGGNIASPPGPGEIHTSENLLWGAFPPGILDVATLGNLLELLGSRSTLEEMVRGYLHQSRESLDQLGQAMEVRNVREGHRLSHALKSGSNTLGARRLGELCGDMEAMMKAGDMQGPLPLLDRARDEFTKVETALSLLLERLEAR